MVVGRKIAAGFLVLLAALVSLWWCAEAPTAKLPSGMVPEVHLAAPAFPTERFVVRTTVDTHVYPPATRKRAPLVVMLHGMCGDALGICDFWNGAGRATSWLVCPSGNARCGDAHDWRGNGETKARHIDAAVAALRSEHANDIVAEGDDILAGFSRGAFVARDVAYARPGRYRGLILLAAALVPDPARLKRSGIRRVVLGAGDFDGAHATMQRAALVLQNGGLEARYVSLGPIHHALPDDLERVMKDALAWIRAAP